MSNSSPAAAALAAASSRVCSHRRWPILYDGACPGQPRYRFHSNRMNASGMLTLALRNSHPLSASHVPPPHSSRCRQAQVDAQVEHHARRPHALAVEHAEAVARVVEEAEVRHEPLAVERPALAVPGGPAREPAPPVERRPLVDRLTDLQVMARDALVVDGRLLPPGVERGDLGRHRPPHAARPAEVVARRRCSRSRRSGSARSGTPGARSTSGMSKCAPSRASIAASAVSCIHACRASVPVQQAGRVLVEHRDGVRDGRARTGDLRGDGLLLGDDPRELLEPPLVRLVQVDRGAEELPRPQRVPLADRRRPTTGPAGRARRAGSRRASRTRAGRRPRRAPARRAPASTPRTRRARSPRARP